MLPQPNDLVHIGLTDEEDHAADGHHPEVPDKDIEFLLGILNTALAVPLARSEVVGSFAGLRPLVRTAPRSATGGTADISRRHLIHDVPGEPITVVGGKLTTYRAMAQDAVDAVTARLGINTPCTTKTVPLVGAGHRAELAALDAPARLVASYGTEAPAVAALGRRDPALAEPLYAGTSITGAELLFGILAEGAASVDDLLGRRTRLSLVRSDAAKAHARATEILAAAQGSP